MALSVEYKDGEFYIVRISEKKYYFGDGETLNSIGISANQFLRFHPYMDYVGGSEKPPDKIVRWIEQNT